ncbi:MAG: ABC transporter ATP-binding protein, partial [Streptosporangiaceae bacterium]
PGGLMAETLLEVRDVVAGYGYGDILRGTSLSVAAGSITCVIGPNGAGKSTLLRVISGLLRPSQGEVLLRGRRLSGALPKAILQAGVVQVPQDRSLFPRMTVRENILMGGYVIKDHATLHARLEEVTERFPAVAQLRGQKAGALSGGQQRIVEFARALMLDPTLILLDEPSLGLDPRSRRLVFDTVLSLKEGGRTVLMVEQNAHSGLGVSDYGAVMDLGSVELTGRAPELLTNPEVGRLYLGASAAHHRRLPHDEHQRT